MLFEHLRQRDHNVMAHIFAHFDESGKFKDHKVVSFAGYAAGWEALSAFDTDWSYWLRHYGLQTLTMKRALNHRIPLSQKVKATSSQERTTVLMNFADSILRHFEFGVYVAVDVVSFRSLSSDATKLLGKNPHYMAFSRCLGEVSNFYPADLKIALVCDDEDEYSVECYKIYRKMKAGNQTYRKRFTSISFADDVDSPHLQAADMLSSMARLEALRLIHGSPHDYQSLFSHLVTPLTPKPTYQGGCFGKTQLESLAGKLLKAKKQGKAPVPLVD
jgi:hypothetical protein